MDEAPNNRSKPALRWATERLAFSLSEKKFVVSRMADPKLPHLTLSWGNRSREIDLHLTYGDGRHVPLARLPEQLLQQAGLYFEQVAAACFEPVIEVFRPVRPGWLARRGYVLMAQEEEQVVGFLKELAPKERGKYRLRLDSLEEKIVPKLADNVTCYSPRLLKFEGVQETFGFVVALAAPRLRRPKPYIQWLPFDPRLRLFQRSKRRQRKNTSSLAPSLAPPVVPQREADVRWCWLALPEKELQAAIRSLLTTMLRLLAAILPPNAVEIFDRIVVEMDLTGVPSLVDVIPEFRALLADPAKVAAEMAGQPFPPARKRRPILLSSPTSDGHDDTG